MAKKLLRRELFAFLWEKLEQDIPKQCYELEVTSDQAEYSGYELVKKNDNISNNADPTTNIKVIIQSGEMIMEDQDFGKEFCRFINLDDEFMPLKSGLNSKNDIESWINSHINSFLGSYESLNIDIQFNSPSPIFLKVEYIYYKLEELNKDWTDELYDIDDEKMDSFISDIVY